MGIIKSVRETVNIELLYVQEIMGMTYKLLLVGFVKNLIEI